MTEEQIIQQALAEDIGEGDITTQAIVPPNCKDGKARIAAKQDLCLAGVDIARKVFILLDPHVNYVPKFNDGDWVKSGEVIAEVSGPVGAILSGERTALNFLQHLSGIATLTHRYAERLKAYHTRIKDTRKTVPGLRLLEKYAVRCGGGTNHRLGLYDGILIKNNHAAIAGGIIPAVELMRNYLAHHELTHMPIEVEAHSLSQVEEALSCKANVILLDNLTLGELAQAVKMIGKQAITEVSGNVSLDNIVQIAQLGVDFISVGAITHSAPAADIHLRL